MKNILAPHPNPLPARGDRGRGIRSVEVGGSGAACPFAPFTGRRCRQADEGQVLGKQEVAG
ncbi:hypothetical protein GFL85_00475 [Rhizobium laguerreae]|nr:hypothetical protein [Rhizobium laguerreae]